MEQASGSQHCRRCGQWKPVREFYSLAVQQKRKLYFCRQCNRAEQAARYRPWKDYVNAIKLARGCVDCGYREFAEALEFDHLPGVVKLGNVSKLARAMVPFAVLDAEIAKCELVCANCHRVRTVRRTAESAPMAYWDLAEDKRRIRIECALVVADQLPFGAA